MSEPSGLREKLAKVGLNYAFAYFLGKRFRLVGRSGDEVFLGTVESVGLANDDLTKSVVIIPVGGRWDIRANLDVVEDEKLRWVFCLIGNKEKSIRARIELIG
jgi:hypothetical protein